jgi:hypothetical protein
MISGKGFGALPLSTINPAKIGAQATDVFDTLWRPLQWAHTPTNENMQQPENEASLWSLLQTVKGVQNPWDNPTLWWRVENRLNMFTNLTAAMSNADEYIAVAEALLIKPGYILYLPQTQEQILVVDVDAAGANSWTTAGGAAANVRVDRGFLPGPSVAAAVGAEVRAGVPMMGEFGEPKEGVVTTPGDPMYNFIQLFGLYIQISRMQKESLMAGDYGTHQQLVKENEAYLAQQLQNTVLFGRRGTINSAGEGMVYLTNGLIPQIKSNVLSVEGNGNELTFANVSEFIDQTFESANSSATKVVAAGERLYINMLNTARQEGKLTEETHYNPALGVDEFRVVTGGGKSASVQKHRFAMQGSLKDWGLVLDMGNIATGEYKGFDFKWYMDLEAPMQAITKKTDAMVGSIAVTVYDQDTCGIIKGGVEPLLDNRNGLGIIED